MIILLIQGQFIPLSGESLIDLNNVNTSVVNTVESADASYNVLVGNREWMTSNGVEISDIVESKLTREEEAGR